MWGGFSFTGFICLVILFVGTTNALSASLTLSNKTIDVGIGPLGQGILFTATATSGTQPYTYNYQITNSVTNAVIANALYKSISSATNTYYWKPIGSAGDTVRSNVIITDSSPSTVASAFTNIGYNAAPTVTITSNTPFLTYTFYEYMDFAIAMAILDLIFLFIYMLRRSIEEIGDALDDINSKH